MHPQIGLSLLCGLLGFSRQAFYKSIQSKTSRLSFHAIVADLVVEIRSKINNEKLGCRKLHPLINEQLSKQGLSVGRDQLFEIMNTYGLKVRSRKRRKPCTTDNTHGFKRYPNLIKDMVLLKSEQLMVSDITYIRVKEKFMYLSLITDSWSRKIMGYCLHKDLSTEGPMNALLMAVANRSYPNRRLIHHSDQGVQYCSHSYISMLKTNSITISMASKGSPHENALAERINGILKHEYGLNKIIESEERARRMVELAVESYNSKRPHNSLSGLTPEQAHSADKLKKDLTPPLTGHTRIKSIAVKCSQDLPEQGKQLIGLKNEESIKIRTNRNHDNREPD
ncbi:IS3 family transposase [Marinoscillum pacificum]|uniref:IS3 family transposase n=1 Tax=Marinoscillum pacificum TaxID=392723 RepID=UPI002156FEFD|nr:IS3 family transposase [Marinoscillum pacificum]